MSANKLIIRPANETDVQAAFSLTAELGYPGLSPARFAETYHEVLKHPAMLLMVAEDENQEIVGLALVSNRPQLRLTGVLITLDEFVVAERFRGRAVGRELLDAVQAMARKLGAR